MCEILGSYKEKDSFVGYKVAVKRNGKYYSYWTGVEYKIGPVEECKDMSEKGIVTTTDLRVSYNPKMKGYTGLFYSLEDAEYNCKYHWMMYYNPIVFLKMKISNDLQKGQLRTRTLDNELYFINIVIGKEILEIKEIGTL